MCLAIYKYLFWREILRKRLDYLDGLRGVAILGVVLIHVGHMFIGSLPHAIQNFTDYGFRSVQLFFIVSSLTLTMSLFGKDYSIRGYAIKRYFRIAPMFYLAIIGYIYLYGTAPGPAHQDGLSLRDIVLTIFLMHSLTPTSINSVVPGAWSVGSEILFYFLLPFLLSVATNLRRSIILLVASVIFSFIARFVLERLLAPYFEPETLGLFIHFGFFQNLPAFLCGIVLFHIMNLPKTERVLSKPKAVLLLAFAFLCLTAAGLIGGSAQHILVGDVFLSLLLIGAGLSQSRVIDNPILKHIGVVSFSIYLWHFLIIDILQPLPGYFSSSPMIGLLIVYAISVSASVAVATITYRYVELPMIKLGRRIAERNTVGLTTSRLSR
jgi:peptidoglycan/LPS O-acetylase OafA/YrhL